MEDLRDSVQVQRGRVRGNTPEGAEFFFSQKVRLVFCFFVFLRGGLLCAGTFVVRRTVLLEVHRSGGKEKSPTLKLTFLP